MKKTISSYLSMITIVVAFTLISCNKKPKIGLLMDEYNNGRWVHDKELFTEKVSELGGEVYFRASEGDAEKQLEMAKELLQEDLSLLVVIPTDQYKAASIVKLANKRGVPVMSYDRLIKNCNLNFHISFDNVNVGELQSEYVTKACPTGNYALLGGSVADNNSFLLRLGQLNILQPLIDKGDVNIVFDSYADSWNASEGYRLMKECLKENEEIDAVIASNDLLAQGAINALVEANVENMPYVTGQDADLEACRRIISGLQSMTVYKPIEAITSKAAEIAMKMAEENVVPTTYLTVNNGKKQVPAVLLPSMTVSKETIDLTVVADGYLKEHNLGL